MAEPATPIDVVSIPKAELHLHLEGAIRPKTALDLARANGVDFSYATEDDLTRALAFGDFLTFLDVFGRVNLCLCTFEDFQRITAELIEDLAAQSVRYAEIRYSPMRPMMRGVTLADITAGVIAGVTEGMRRHPEIHVELICGLTRQFGPDAAMACAREAAHWLGRGVVGLDIGGDEVNAPAEQFQEVYRFAHNAGFLTTAHAGEAAGPESVWSAVRTLGVRRIGHGVRAAEDPDLVAFLRDEGVTLEVCPTSNIRTRISREYAAHPLRDLHQAGVPVTLSSDDPAMFLTSISHEYEVAAREFRFSKSELLGFTRTSIEAGFCAAEVKRRLLAELPVAPPD